MKVVNVFQISTGKSPMQKPRISTLILSDGAKLHGRSDDSSRPASLEAFGKEDMSD